VERLEAEVSDPEKVEERLQEEIAQLRREVNEGLSSVGDRVARSDRMLHELGQGVSSLVQGRDTGPVQGPEHGR
jgi:hypothetical protein